MNLGKGIKIARKEKNLTQVKLSEITGIDKVRLSYYETNSQTPNTTSLKRICKGIGVSVVYVMWLSLERDSEEVINKYQYDINKNKIDNMMKEIFSH